MYHLKCQHLSYWTGGLIWLAAMAGWGSPIFHSDANVFYLVHSGGDLRMKVEVLKMKPGRRGNPAVSGAPAAFFTVYDQEERPVKQVYHRFQPGETERSFTFLFPQAGAGVWQIRSSMASNQWLGIRFKTEPELKYGVMQARCRMLDEDLPNFRCSYFMAIPGVSELRVTCRGPQTDFYDAAGKHLAFDDIGMVVGADYDLNGNTNRALPPGTVEICRGTVGPTAAVGTEDGKMLMRVEPGSSASLTLEADRIYRLDLDSPGRGYLTLNGPPVILCPDADTARVIGNSLEVMPDGTRLPHRFQVRMWRWMNGLKPADLAVKVRSLKPYRKAWLAGAESRALLGIFAYAGDVLASQRFDLKRIGYHPTPIPLGNLALLYALNRPFNPYYRDRGLMNRLFYFHFQKLLTIRENGSYVENTPGLEWNGLDGMLFLDDNIALALMAKEADPELARLWKDGLAYQTHLFWHSRLTCENQSLHWPVKLYCLALATGDSMYRRMAHDYMADFLDERNSECMKTGYPLECFGLDGTYTGISTAMLAFAYRLSGDGIILDALRKIYGLMNHTVVPEPTGGLVGANGFAHRTCGSWLNRQYEGGTSLVADVLPEAACLPLRSSSGDFAAYFDQMANRRETGQTADWSKSAAAVINRYPLATFNDYWERTVFQVKAPLKGILPAAELANFTRNFNREFLAVRRTGYYLFGYTGDNSWRAHHWRAFRKPQPDTTTMENGVLMAKHASRTWPPLQGVDIFWTPEFGAAILSKNWSLFTHHTVRGDRNGQVVDWPAVWTFSGGFDPGSQEVVFNHRFRSEPVRVKRRITLGEREIRIGLSVRPSGPIQVMVLVEQLPFQYKPGLKIRYDERSIRLSNAAGHGVSFEFDRPVKIRCGVDSTSVQSPGEKMGLLEVSFAELRSGQSAELNYRVKGF